MSLSQLAPFRYIKTEPSIGDGIRCTQVKFQPQGWFNQGAIAQPNHYIRFDFRSDGFWDPKTAYIQIDVDCSQMPPNTVYQVDNSAQSIIGQYIARKDGVELIRIQEYDEIAALLYDVHIGLDERTARVGEGVGRNHPESRQLSKNNGSASYYTPHMQDITVWPPSWDSGGTMTADEAWHNTHVAPLNCTFRPYLSCASARPNVDWIDTRAHRAVSYLDSFAMDDIQGFDGLFAGQTAADGDFYTFIGNMWLPTTQIGFGRTNTEASIGGGEYWMSNYCLKPTIKAGLPAYERSTHASFQIPLLCPLFGATSTHGKLLPMRLFDGLEFEFLLNPYAFFACGNPVVLGSTTPFGLINNTGFNPGGTEAFGHGSPNRFSWSVTKFEICVEITHLPVQETQRVMDNLSSGFEIDFKCWYLGPRTKMPGGTSLNTTVQINNGFSSLNILAFYFQPADYERYPHCRKHKRISNNLTSMQLRIGTEYIPSLPVVGHAGNIRPDYQSANYRGNYVEFFVHTMKAFGKWLGANTGGILNPTNYTANTIGYDPEPSTTTTGLVTDIANNSLYGNQELYLENSIIPRSIFAFDLERFDMIKGVRSGTDTTMFRPFDLLLQNDTGAVTVDYAGGGGPSWAGATYNGVLSTTISNPSFPRPYYMYVWMYYDARIRWTSSSGWMVEGRV